MNDPSRGGLHPIQDVLDSFLRSSGLQVKRAETAVFRAWRDALGERLARRARAVRFAGGELVVEVRSSAHLQELKNFTGEDFRRRANERLPQPAIESIVFKLRH